MRKEETHQNPSVETLDIEGTRYPFHLYIPETLQCSHILVWGHGSITNEENLVYITRGQHEHYATVFESLGLAAIMPVLPRREAPNHTEDLDAQMIGRHVMVDKCDGYYHRPDRDILLMIEHTHALLADKGHAPSTSVLFGGFSAGGNMANRMSTLYPDISAGCISFVSGLFTYPEVEIDGVTLPYPFGVADIETISGTHFDKNQYLQIPTYIFVGQNETSPKMGPFNYEARHLTEAIDDFRRVLGTNPLEITQKFAEYLIRQGANAKLVAKPGATHEFSRKDVEAGLRFLIDNTRH